MQWSAGSLVRARGRDWVALPAALPGLVRLKPLTGPDHQEIGLFLPLEKQVEPASFPLPDPGSVADAAAARHLFDAARLTLRSGAAPFRSLGHISVSPRPYQFVPLIMALRLDPVRLLIADDVGVGKTIEAGMIVRELLDRGIARRLCVLCPAHLCEQWERELRQKFAIEAAVVRPSSVARLERELPRQDLSIYEHYSHLIASIDFVKAERHRGPFLRTAPDLVIVDEAHGAARPPGGVVWQLCSVLMPLITWCKISATSAPSGSWPGRRITRTRLAGARLLDVDRQETAAAMGVKAREFLVAVHPVRGVVDVEHDPARHLGEAVVERLDHGGHPRRAGS